MELSDDFAAMAAAAEALLIMRRHPIPPDYVPEWLAPPAAIPASSSSSRGGCANLGVPFLDPPRRRRSRHHTRARTMEAKELRLGDEAKVVRRKGSPETPLEFSGGSGESTSFGEEGSDMGMSVQKRRKMVMKLEAEAAGGGLGCGFDEGTSYRQQPVKRKIRIVGFGMGERKDPVSIDQDAKLLNRPSTEASLVSEKQLFEETTSRAPAPPPPLLPSENRQGGFLLPDLNLPLDELES